MDLIERRKHCKAVITGIENKDRISPEQYAIRDAHRDELARVDALIRAIVDLDEPTIRAMAASVPACDRTFWIGVHTVRALIVTARDGHNLETTQ